MSLPQLSRIRSILQQPELMVVVQDMFLSETAELADVVLPAAGWGEKTGTFTNVDRTVHLSEQAVDPPGEARPDLDIFLDYARRMDFRNRDGDPLIGWSDAEGAFEAWKACSKGRPCDYSGMSYALLRERGAIQWPCTAKAPEGTERLYTDGVFNTSPDYAEGFGHDMRTGASHTEEQFRAKEPRGRAFLHTLPYEPAPEMPTADYPMLLTTGRTVYHFHTRTKTSRAPQLQAAAPAPWAELSAPEAERLGIAEGDIAAIETPRGRLELPVRISGISDGVVFVPFHYGSMLADEQHEPTAANELTITAWDPVSKQPQFKDAAARVEKVRDGEGPAPAPDIGGAQAVLGELVSAPAGGDAARADETIGGH